MQTRRLHAECCRAARATENRNVMKRFQCLTLGRIVKGYIIIIVNAYESYMEACTRACASPVRTIALGRRIRYVAVGKDRADGNVNATGVWWVHRFVTGGVR